MTLTPTPLPLEEGKSDFFPPPGKGQEKREHIRKLN